MSLDILHDAEYLIQWVCQKLAKRVAHACFAKLRQVVYKEVQHLAIMLSCNDSGQVVHTRHYGSKHLQFGTVTSALT